MLRTLAKVVFVFASAAVAFAQAGVCPNNVAQTISNGLIAPVPYAKIYMCPQNSSMPACLASGGTSGVTLYGSTALATTGSITAYSASSGILTLTMSSRPSPFGVGETVTFSGFTGGLSALNSQTLAVLGTPAATTTSFAVATGLVTGSGSDSGTATPVALSNPFTTDVGGNYFFCLGVGHYTQVISGSQGFYFVPDITIANNASAGTAASLLGGALGSVPYQSGPNATTFMASPTTSGRTFVPAWQPSGSAIAPAPIDLESFIDGVLPTIYYQFVQANGSSQTQQPKLNFLPRFTATNNSFNNSTDVDLPTVATPATCANPTSITYDAYGRVTASSCGGASGPVQELGTGTVTFASTTFTSSAVTYILQTFTLPLTPPAGAVVVGMPRTDLGDECQYTVFFVGNTLYVKVTHGQFNLPYTVPSTVFTWTVMQ